MCAGSHSVNSGVLQSGEGRSYREESTESCTLREGGAASWYVDMNLTLVLPISPKCKLYISCSFTYEIVSSSRNQIHYHTFLVMHIFKDSQVVCVN